MDTDIAVRVRACRVCGLSKPAQNTHYSMLSSDVATRPMEKLSVDFVGKLPCSKSGNAYAVVCVDDFTKFVWICLLQPLFGRYISFLLPLEFRKC
jgi:hypothetical protein